jgi:Skp family chaperone for outer membrane proteins
LRAIENAERLVQSLGDAEGAGTDKLRKATKRFAQHLKEELTAWEDKYKKARAGA